MDLYAENHKMLMKEINISVTMFMDLKSQHSKDVRSPQIDIKV